MEFNHKSMKPLYLLVAFGVLLFWALQNLSLLARVCSTILGLLLPFLMGGSIAFILNVPMRKIETLLFPKPNKVQKKLKRPISLALTIVALCALIAIVFGLVIPELSSSFILLRDNIIRFLRTLEQENPALLNESLSYLPSAAELAALDWESIVKNALTFLGSGAGSFINSTVNVASRIFNGLLAFFIGFIFAIYLLFQKETVARQMRRLLYAYLPEKVSDQVIRIARLSEKIFSDFLSGQCLDALILGVMFFIATTIFRFPYALMISVLIGVLALIPIFGAFIGCIIGAFMILMTDGFIKMLSFIAVFLVLQQLEENFIYPKVVGNSVGLPAIWVFVAVTLGGSAWGVLGMLLFIPLCSVFYALLRENANKRLKKSPVSKSKIS